MARTRNPYEPAIQAIQANQAALVLAQIHLLRQADAYQAAEERRREIGARNMALYPADSEERKQIRIMINTWETIAVMAEGIGLPWEEFYRTNPICHMWNELRPAITVFRATQPSYAAAFQRLFNNHNRWLRTQRAQYRSDACQGMNASFG